VAWRFQAAAPIPDTPAVTESGLVYVSTVEGYVHALAADGAFRWSYGVEGVPIGAPAVDHDGEVYVATSARRVYAIRADGHLRWVHRAPARITTSVVSGASSTLYFGASDQRLYALATWGGTLWSRALGQAIVGRPAVSLDGWVGIGTARPELCLFQSGSLVSQLELPAPLRQPVVLGLEHRFAVTGGELLAFDEQRKPALAWRAAARYAAASENGEWLVVEDQGQLRWLSPRTGQELDAVSVPGDPSAPPALTNSGVAILPLVSGELLVASRQGATLRFKVAASPLWGPSWNEHGNRLVVAAGSGSVASVELGGWPGAPSEPPGPSGSADAARSLTPGSGA
jgi:PQQ-like domain